jgi:putative SOS response-associated peptidase YedK
MCARYQLELTHTQLESLLALVESYAFDPAPDVRPTDVAPVVLHSRLRAGPMSTPMRWGLVPSWATSPTAVRSTFNARIETASTLPSFRSAWAKRRAVIPASAWTEWTGPKGAKTRWTARHPDGGVVWLAGLWETWNQPNGTPLRSFTVLTQPARDDLTWLHDRMPVVLDRAQIEPWLLRTVDAPPLFDGTLDVVEADL